MDLQAILKKTLPQAGTLNYAEYSGSSIPEKIEPLTACDINDRATILWRSDESGRVRIRTNLGAQSGQRLACYS